MIYTVDDFNMSKAYVGDLVTEELVMEYMNFLTPATFRLDCMQIGEPHSHKYDPRTKRVRPTFGTFSRVYEGVYMYCGNCFCGEVRER